MIERKERYNTKYARNFIGKSTKYLQTEVNNDHQLNIVYRLNTLYKCIKVGTGQRTLFGTFTQRDLRYAT